MADKRDRRQERVVNSVAVYYLIYTAVFAVFAALVFFPFWSQDKSFVFRTDGMVQHYTALRYYGTWLRKIASGLVQTHRLTIPLWDSSIGYGADVLTTLSYYVIGDPLALTSAFVPESYTELLYDGLVLLRFYLAGAAFSAYCLSRGKGRAASLAGAVTYTFCTYAVYAGVKHPFFLNPMIYFPLLLIGAERVLKKKKPGLFVFMVFISALSNFYFFYMIVLGTIIYLIFRYFSLDGKRTLRGFLSMILHFLLYGVIGTLMSMALFLPTVLLFKGTLRSEAVSPLMLLYPASYYKGFLIGFLSVQTGTDMYWTLLGYTWPVVPALITLFVRNRKKDMRQREGRVLGAAFITLTIMLMLPVFGRIFNGFAYVSNRWVWIYSALIAFILADSWDHMAEFLRRRNVYSGAFVLGIFILMGTQLGLNSFFQYDSHFGDRISLYLENGTATERMDKEQLPILSDLAAESGAENFWRYEKSTYEVENETLLSGQRGLQYYWSLAAASPSVFQLDLQLNPMCTYNYMGLGGRTFLDELAGVRYYCAAPGGSAPFGYKKLMDASEKTGGYRIYENKYALPMGYTYSGYVSQSRWKALDPLKRAQTMMQAAVLSDEDAKSFKDQKAQLKETEPKADSIEVPCSVSSDKGGKKKGANTYQCRENRYAIRVDFQGKEKCETYLLIKGLKAETKEEAPIIRIKVRGKKTVKTYLVQAQSRSYYGQDDILVNLGYYEKAQDRARIRFNAAGSYSFDKIQVLCQPVNSYEGYVKALSNDTMDAKEGVNEISGSIHLDRGRLLCLAIPYVDGWKAQVDGKPARLIQTNDMFTSLYLPSGDHEVKLTYFTPGLKAGIIVSAGGWAAFLALLVLAYQKRHRTKDLEVI